MADNTRDVIYLYDMERRVQYANPACEKVAGYTLQELYARNFISYLHPDDSDRMLQLWDTLFQGQSFENAEFRVVTRDGRTEWRSATWNPVYDETGRQIGVQGREMDITQRKLAEEVVRHARESAERAVEQLAHLQAVTAALSQAATPTQVVEVIVNKGAAALGARAGAVLWLSADGQWLENLRGVGYDESFIVAYQRIPLSAPMPLAEAVRIGQPIWIRSAEDYQARYPHLGEAIARLGYEAAAAMPLMYQGRAVGVLALSFNAGLEFTPEQREHLLLLTGQCTQALERARLYEAEQRARREAERAVERVTRLQQITAALAEALTPLQVAEAVIRQCVPAMCPPWAPKPAACT